MSNADRPLRVLVVTNMWPGEKSEYTGIFVQQQVDSLRAEAPDWTFDVFTMAGHRGRGDYVRAVPRVRRALAGGYDVVHAHYGFTAVTVALAERRTPLVVTLHGGDVNLAWQRAITRLAAWRASAMVVVSPRMRAGWGDASARVIPCGVMTDRYQPMDRAAARAQLGVPADAFVPLFPGDPSNPVKDYPLFLGALALLPEDVRARMHALTLGKLRPGEVPLRMGAADVVVLTSISEGSPMVVKEALSCGRPVVSVDVGDVADVLRGLPGCAVTPRHAPALAPLIEAAARRRQSPDDVARLRGSLRERGLDDRTVARSLLALYRSVAGAEPARAG